MNRFIFRYFAVFTIFSFCVLKVLIQETLIIARSAERADDYANFLIFGQKVIFAIYDKSPQSSTIPTKEAHTVFLSIGVCPLTKS